MKIKLIFPMIFFALAFSFVNAQEQPRQEIKTVTVATVNIYDSKIVSQEGNTFKISFDLSNRDGAQPDIRYSVSLIEQTEKGQNLMDEKIYDEKTSLTANETIKKEITYQAPAYLKGKYNLVLFAKNSASLTLSISSLGEVELKGTGEYIQIKNETCYLTIEGDQENTKYNLVQGVDIAKTETLLANCEVKNNYSREVVITPKFTTHHRTTYGYVVPTESLVYEPIVIGKGQVKTVLYKLPKPEKSQAYDVVMELVGKDSKYISSKVVFHYVLQGPSATIQNITLDKDYYLKGETAKAKLYLSASADSFPNSRASANPIKQEMNTGISIKNKQGVSCAQYYFSKDRNQIRDIDFSIIEDCQDPTITVTLKDDQGNVLDTKELKITSKNIPQKSEKNTKKEGMDPKTLIMIVLIVFISIIFIIGLIYAIRKRNV